RRLHMDDRALNDALETGGGLGVVVAFHHEIVEFAVDVIDEIALQLLDVDIARTHDGGGVLILDQREQQVLQRRVFVVALVRKRKRAVKRLLQTTRKGRHSIPFRSFPTHFFSITHCKGCWCLREKSITCVTLVSATS